MFSKSDLESRLMDAINKRLTKKGEPPGTEKYWTCRNRKAHYKTSKQVLERKRCQEVLIRELSKSKNEQNTNIIDEYDARQQIASSIWIY